MENARLHHLACEKGSVRLDTARYRQCGSTSAGPTSESATVARRVAQWVAADILRRLRKTVSGSTLSGPSLESLRPAKIGLR